MKSRCRRHMKRFMNREPFPVSLSACRTLSRFFEFALALSAWKKAGESEWALRSNPSSGQSASDGRLCGLTKDRRTRSETGSLSLRAEGTWSGVAGRVCSAEHVARLLAPFPADAFLFGLTSVHWREAWKYGERAFRYCNHDVGHAIGSTRSLRRRWAGTWPCWMVWIKTR